MLFGKKKGFHVEYSGKYCTLTPLLGVFTASATLKALRSPVGDALLMFPKLTCSKNLLHVYSNPSVFPN